MSDKIRRMIRAATVKQKAPAKSRSKTPTARTVRLRMTGPARPKNAPSSSASLQLRDNYPDPHGPVWPTLRRSAAWVGLEVWG